MFYSSLASYNAASTNNTVIGFEGIAANGAFQSVATPPGITLSGVNFTIDRTNDNGKLFVIGQDYYYTGNSVLSSQQSSTGPNNLLITLPGSYTAFAINFGTFGESTLQFTLSTGATFSEASTSYPDLDFVGVTSTVGITSMTITVPAADVLNVDNFTFGTVKPSGVPEPPAVAMLGIGMVAILGFARLRRAFRAASFA